MQNESIEHYFHFDYLHMKDELCRHSSATVIFGSFLSLFSAPVLFLEGLPMISLEYIAAIAAIFLVFSFLPDIARFFCNAFRLHKINAISHSFGGALFSSAALVPALFLFDIWEAPLIISGFLGYLFHLFIDSVEGAIEWWTNSLQAILATPIFVSLGRHSERLTRL